MITIFCDFSQFSAKKLAFFSKTNVITKLLYNLPLFKVKNAKFFAEFFGENILKIITSVPGSQSCGGDLAPGLRKICQLGTYVSQCVTDSHIQRRQKIRINYNISWRNFVTCVKIKIISIFSYFR
jgi:hypothetical protein